MVQPYNLYATPKAGSFDYHYFVCDYLGSVRAVVAEDGTVEETSDYYPYGMLMPNSEGEIPDIHQKARKRTSNRKITNE